ncbi:MAG: Ppx/GppA family phosphatase [Nitrospirae bacterium]|nr:Ppx/GppA family phosphatase [Nitrospirota bacterium]
MFPLASIDIGSNTIRLLIGRIQDKTIVRLVTEMFITRLAAGIAETGKLRAESMEKSVSVLKRFSQIISEYNVSGVKAIGTSALRDAKNSDEFIQRVWRETGIKIDVVSGKKEAELTAKGVLWGIEKSGTFLIVDIGGGSTEWILCKDSAMTGMGTMPIGVVRLYEKHIKQDLPSKEDLVSLGREIEVVLNKLKAEIGRQMTNDTVFIGTAGTITTLATIDLGLDVYSHEKINMHSMLLQRLYKIYYRLTSISLRERKNLKGLEPERADLIIPGILFTIKIMEIFGFKNLIVSDNGLLEGAFIKLSEEALKLT